MLPDVPQCPFLRRWHLTPRGIFGGNHLSPTGLPGGLDYAMLAMEKHGLLDRETEKLWNARINVWIRAPGLSYVTFCIYNSMLYFPIGISASQFLAAIVVSLLCILNGQYYMQKVVGNTARKVRTYSC